MAYSHARTHIKGLTPEKVRELINHPFATYEDLDSLWFAVSNIFGWSSPLLDEIERRIAILQYAEKLQNERLEVLEGEVEEFIDLSYKVVP